MITTSAQQSQITNLKTQIRDQLVYNYPGVDTFRDLTHVEVFNLKRVGKKQHTSIPESGTLKGYISDGDVVEFEIKSSDIWVRIYITLINSDTKHKSTFELRVPRDMSISSFKAYIIKTVIIIWNQIKMHNIKDATFYFL